jgi:hypothetical protein
MLPSLSIILAIGGLDLERTVRTAYPILPGQSVGVETDRFAYFDITAGEEESKRGLSATNRVGNRPQN